MATDEFVREGGAATLALCATLSASDGRLDTVRQLAAAAGAVLKHDEVRDAAEDTYGEIFGPERILAIIKFRDGKLVSLETSLWCWELPYREDYPSREAYRAAQARFRELFERERQRAVGLLGEPDHDRTDSGERHFRYAAWRREGAMVIVCETDYDPQFGERIMVFLRFESVDGTPPGTTKLTGDAR